jgi:hypothetical protein
VTSLLNQPRLPALLDTSAEQARDTSASLVTYAQVDLTLPLLQMVLLVTCALREPGVAKVLPPPFSVLSAHTTHTKELMLSLFAKYVPLEPNAPAQELSSLLLLTALQEMFAQATLSLPVLLVLTALPVP